MKKLIIILNFLIVGCYAQQTRILTLSNSDVIISYNYYLDYHLSDKSKLFLNKEFKVDIIKGLKNENQVLISHVLLTKLFKPDSNFSYEYIYGEDRNIVDTIFELNGLKWHIINDEIKIVSCWQNLYSLWENELR